MRVMPNQAFVALTSCLLASCLAGGAFAQKATMAVRGFQATPAVEAAAAASGTLNALNQIMQGAQSQLENAIQTGGKFDIVARADLASILKEQDLAASGLVDTLSPGAARSLQLAGARYLAILNVDGFQDVTDTTVLQKQLGATRAERRTIQLSGVVKVFDTTSGKIIASIALKMNQSQLDEVMPGVERDGRKTQALLAEVATKLGRDSSLSITDSVFPAKVVAYTVGQITFNRVKSSVQDRNSSIRIREPHLVVNNFQSAGPVSLTQVIDFPELRRSSTTASQMVTSWLFVQRACLLA
jgi:hypothetical protein